MQPPGPGMRQELLLSFCGILTALCSSWANCSSPPFSFLNCTRGRAFTSALNIGRFCGGKWMESPASVVSLHVCLHINSSVYHMRRAWQGTYVGSCNKLLFHCRFPCFTVGEAEAAVHSPAKWRRWDLILTLPHADGESCFRGCVSPVCLNACIVFFLVCVLKRVVVIIYTVFSHAHTFRKRFCVIFIDPLSCLIIPSFVD